MYYPEQIGAKVLEKIKEVAEKRLKQEVKNCVITVPAYFNVIQKQATKDACKLAGLTCKRIINEPTAAAISFGLSDYGGQSNQNLVKCLVFDYGGGTLDVTVLDIKGSDIKVKSTAGDTHCGGQDIDNAMINYCCKRFFDETGVNISKNNKAKARIRRECVAKKLELSDADIVDIQIDNLA